MKNLILMIALFLINKGFAQNPGVGINTTDINALLRIKEIDPDASTPMDGILLPRINQFPNVNPTADQDSMLVYLTTDNKIYYWDQASTSWKWLVHKTASQFNDLLDARTDNDGTNNFSSIYLGANSGINDDQTDNRNVGVGMRSLNQNTSGFFNVGIGLNALRMNSVGSRNTAVGNESLEGRNPPNNVSDNTAIGRLALQNLEAGTYNTAIGLEAMKNTPTGSTINFNTSIGDYSLFKNQADNNTAMGYNVLYNNTSGTHNVTIGTNLFENTTGSYQVAIGENALNMNDTGNNNVAIGNDAIPRNVSGSNNTVVGESKSDGNSTPINTNNCTFMGYSSGTLSNLTNATVLGMYETVTADNMIRITSTFIADIGGYANWTNISDGRFKTQIKENVPGLDFILKLRPVTYILDSKALAAFKHIKIKDDSAFLDIETERQTGFIAQEVEKAAKRIGFNFHGVDTPDNKNDYYGLRYAEFVVPLVKAVQEQQKMIEGINDDISYLDENTSKINELKRKVQLLKQEKQEEK
ncbi:MAG: tail fiber domain-containing protein [Flavobacteriales bacterium]